MLYLDSSLTCKLGKHSCLKTFYLNNFKIWTFLCDSLGRKPALMTSLVLEVIFALAATFVPNYVAYVILRFVVGIAAAGSFTTIFVLCMLVFVLWLFYCIFWVQNKTNSQILTFGTLTILNYFVAASILISNTQIDEFNLFLVHFCCLNETIRLVVYVLISIFLHGMDNIFSTLCQHYRKMCMIMKSFEIFST